VRQEQKQETASIAPNQSKGLPALLTVNHAIIDHDVQRVEKTSLASSKLTPCFRWLERFFASSHSNRISGNSLL